MPPAQIRGVSLCSRVICVVLGWLLLLAMPTVGQSEKPGITQPVPVLDASGLRKPIDLEAIWLVHAGDDPDGRKGWARPEYDDSDWLRVDPAKSLHDVFTQDNPRTVWYRLHIKVSPTQIGLALQEWYLSSAFEVFTNGKSLLKIGEIDPFVPYTSMAKLVVRIPDEQIATGEVVVALRDHLSVAEWNNVAPGFYYSNLTIGQEDALRDRISLANLGGNVLFYFNAIITLVMGIAAFLLYSADRRRMEYLWFAVNTLCNVISWCIIGSTVFYDLPVRWLGVLIVPWAVVTLSSACMFFAFIGRRLGLRLWVFIVFASLVAGYYVADTFSYFLLTADQGALLYLPVELLFGIIIPAYLINHWRRGNREAGILLVPLVLNQFVTIFLTNLNVLGENAVFRSFAIRSQAFFNEAHVGPIVVTPVIVANTLYALAMGIIILLRTNRLSRQGAVMEGEMAAAREVQQILLPEEIETIPGFSVESVYLPAQQVGGDFFQVLPVGAGGLLLVLGDVAGKGLPAAMLVSVLIGAIRTMATYGHDPGEILAQLNERMVGRSNGGFSTALAAYFQAGGTVAIANAGHLSPYLNGEEVELPGALPLGVLSGAKYETTKFDLAQSGRLTFYSDGVIEAQDAKGQLFGFARGKAVSTMPAAVIVEQAKLFGQSDDITVISVVRQTVSDSVAAGALAG